MHPPLSFAHSAPQAWPSLGAGDSLCQHRKGHLSPPGVEHAHAIRGPRGDPLLLRQVPGALAVLWLGAVALAYILWQVHLPPTSGQLHPEEGPTSSRGQGSSRAWEPQRGEAGPQRQPQDACR